MKLLWILTILASIFSGGLCVNAGEKMDEMVVVRPDGFYPPYEMVIDGELTGFHVDLLGEVGKQLNVEVIFKSVPWKRALKMIRDGAADAITFISKTPEREEYVHFIDGNIISHTLDGFFAIKEKAGEISYTGELKQLRGLKIGVLAGYTYGDDFDNAHFLDKDDGAKVETQLLKKLLSGRFDIAVGNVPRIRYIARGMGVEDRLEYLRPFLSNSPNYIGFSREKNIGRFSEKFAEVMTLFKSTPSYDALVKKYGVK